MNIEIVEREREREEKKNPPRLKSILISEGKKHSMVTYMDHMYAHLMASFPSENMMVPILLP